MEPYWDVVKRIIEESDVVLEILDSRLVEASRNKHLEKMIADSGRPKIFVINKADLVHRQVLEKDIEKLGQDSFSGVVYFSNKKRNTVKNLLAKIKQAFDEHGKRPEIFYRKTASREEKTHRIAKADIVVGVVGYPNVGKSSIINALCFKKKAQVSSKAGTTHGIHWISAGNGIKFIDTPGVIPLEHTDETKLALISSKNPEKLKEPDVAAAKIIELFIKNDKMSKIEDFYKLKIELSDDEKQNPYNIIEEIAKKKGHLKKGGVPDDMKVSLNIVRAWQRGELKL